MRAPNTVLQASVGFPLPLLVVLLVNLHQAKPCLFPVCVTGLRTNPVSPHQEHSPHPREPLLFALPPDKAASRPQATLSSGSDPGPVSSTCGDSFLAFSDSLENHSPAVREGSTSPVPASWVGDPLCPEPSSLNLLNFNVSWRPEVRDQLMQTKQLCTILWQFLHRWSSPLL